MGLKETIEDYKKPVCWKCKNFHKISKQYGLCMNVCYIIKNANTGQDNNVYVRVGKYNVCSNYAPNKVYEQFLESLETNKS